jgi:pimeloyl-ACP methyl ester carboxylesterase
MPVAHSLPASHTAGIRFTRLASGAGIAWACHGSDDVPLGLDAATEELAAVVAATGAPRVALLGQSGAAATAIAYAVQHPERVSHLVLLGGYLAGLLHQSPSTQALAFREVSLRLVELGWGRDDPAVQQFFTTRFIPDASLDEARALNEQLRLSCGPQRAVQIMRARTLPDVRTLAPACCARPWCCMPKATRSCRWRWGAIWRRPSPARASSRCRRATTSRWRQTLASSCSANR